MFDMTPYEQYTFIICMVVYIVLTVLFLTLIVYILRLSVKLIRNGVDDDRILKLKVKTKKRTRGGLGETIDTFSPTITLIRVLLPAFARPITATYPLLINLFSPFALSLSFILS